MRRLLAAAAVALMAGPAMAVDYVKCEAMAKAEERAMAAFTEEAKKVVEKTHRLYQDKHCPVLTAFDHAYGRTNRDCHIKVLQTYKAEIRRDMSKDPSLQPLNARVAKIEADQKKAGCI